MHNHIVVTYMPGKEEKKIYREILEGIVNVHYLADKSENERAELLDVAEVMIALSFSKKEVDPAEIPRMKNVRFIQLVYAGADKIPLQLIQQDTLLACNAGAFAKPLAEHVLALTLTLAKNILPKHKMLSEGKFDRSGFNRELRGGICGIIGFGGNGKEIAKCLGALGMRVYGVNRSGKADTNVDFIGKITEMKKVIQASDVIVVTTPLTRDTKNLIGKEELEWMKKDAILINVGRGDVINQKALYEHLKLYPSFGAGIDTWWSEPEGSETFLTDFPFFELSNIIGSPHCADHVPTSIPYATGKALENVKNYLFGKEIRGLLNKDDYLA